MLVYNLVDYNLSSQHVINKNVFSLASFSLCSLFECVILLELYIRSRILLKYLKITEILSFLDKHDLSKCIKYCFDMALYFQNFPAGADKVSHGQIFSWIRPCYKELGTLRGSMRYKAMYIDKTVPLYVSVTSDKLRQILTFLSKDSDLLYIS